LGPLVDASPLPYFLPARHGCMRRVPHVPTAVRSWSPASPPSPPRRTCRSPPPLLLAVWPWRARPLLLLSALNQGRRALPSSLGFDSFSPCVGTTRATHPPPTPLVQLRPLEFELPCRIPLERHRRPPNHGERRIQASFWSIDLSLTPSMTPRSCGTQSRPSESTGAL
jgi:hypothetical protein